MSSKNGGHYVGDNIIAVRFVLFVERERGKFVLMIIEMLYTKLYRSTQIC